MKTLLYCQHVLGIGHLFRSLRIAAALAPDEVVLVSGGPEANVPLPGNVREVRLEPLAMSEDFSRLYAVGGGDVETVKAERVARLADIMERERPDVFLVELYPFGRKQFRFELDPVLAAIRRGDYGRIAVACSLRDILVEKADQAKFEERAVKIMNRFFDLLLVHTDPSVVRLEETFGSLDRIQARVESTGYVAAIPPPGARERVRAEFGLAEGDGLIVASAGGGKVGKRLLFASARAFGLVRRGMKSARMRLYTGPYLDEQDYQALRRLEDQTPGLCVRRFSSRFPEVLAAADCSVSMAGYNTCLNVLAAGTPALATPFEANREQRMRAERLATRADLELLAPEDLSPEPLAARIQAMLQRGRTTSCGVDLAGAEKSAELLRRAARGG